MATTENTKTVEAPAAPAVVAPAKPERKGKQLSATVTPEFYAEFDDLQWDLRAKTPELVRRACEEFLAKNKPAVKDDAAKA